MYHDDDIAELEKSPHNKSKDVNEKLKTPRLTEMSTGGGCGCKVDLLL